MANHFKLIRHPELACTERRRSIEGQFLMNCHPELGFTERKFSRTVTLSLSKGPNPKLKKNEKPL